MIFSLVVLIITNNIIIYNEWRSGNFLCSEEIRLAINEDSDRERVYADDVDGIYESDTDLFNVDKNEYDYDPVNVAYDPNEVTTNESGSTTPQNSVVTENVSYPYSNFCQMR